MRTRAAWALGLLVLAACGRAPAPRAAADAAIHGTPGTGAPAAPAAAAPPPPTIASRLAELGPAARQRLTADFARAAVPYPPARVTMIGLKDTATLEVWAAAAVGPWRHIHTYAIAAASGGAGPKLREGDGQVPEGMYRIDWLNPTSAYHLSLHVDYPNAADRARAAADGRDALGGDIMIHGDAVSIGCLAMGDQAAEELFVLAADTGVAEGRVEVILAPTDLRAGPRDEVAVVPADAPPWTATLYAELRAALAPFAPPPR